MNRRRGAEMVAAGLALWGLLFALATPGVTLDSIGTRVDNPTGLTLSFPLNFFAGGKANEFTTYLAVHRTSAFSSGAPVSFALSADDHAFLLVGGKLVLDDSAIKSVGSPVSTAFALAGNHTLGLFFADVHVSPSGVLFSCDGCQDPTSVVPKDATSTLPEPAALLLFGTTLVGIGAVLRRRMRSASTSSST